jgi:hypothetical protein
MRNVSVYRLGFSAMCYICLAIGLLQSVNAQGVMPDSTASLRRSKERLAALCRPFAQQEEQERRRYKTCYDWCTAYVRRPGYMLTDCYNNKCGQIQLPTAEQRPEQCRDWIDNADRSASHEEKCRALAMAQATCDRYLTDPSGRREDGWRPCWEHAPMAAGISSFECSN